MYVSGIFANDGLSLVRDRYYPLEELKRAYAAYQPKIDNGISFGYSWSEPNQLDSEYEQFIKPDHPNITHLIKEIRCVECGERGTFFEATVLILDVPMGKAIAKAIDKGANYTFRARGIGNTYHDPRDGDTDLMRINDYELISIDICYDPQVATPKISKTTWPK